jgi:tetratricopeptide (TPR) repeat protein
VRERKSPLDFSQKPGFLITYKHNFYLSHGASGPKNQVSIFGIVWLLGGILLVLGLASQALAQAPVSPAEAMQIGNRHYEAGEFVEAANVYETIIAAGLQDSALYYNLGNAYFKQGEIGRAILNYRRAQYLNPRDPDIADNLAIARSQTVDKFETVEEETPFSNFVQVAEEWLTLDEAAMLALGLWVLLCATAVVMILRPRWRSTCLWVGGALALFLALGLLSMAGRYYAQEAYPAAVIIAQEIDVTSGPGTAQQYLVEFNLHAGAEVLLLDSRPGWRRVALPGNDFQGWVPEEAVEPVVPAEG